VAILDAIRFSNRLLAQRPKNERKILVLISETKDDGSTASVDSVVRQLEASNTLIYSAAYSASPTESLLKTPTNEQSGVNLLAVFSAITRATKENVSKSVAQLSGGEYLPFTSEHDFETQLAKIGNHYFDQYLLSFQPKKPQPGQHALVVRLRDTDNVIIHSRTGYWVASTVQPE
jgi:hypothetical protein